MIRVVGTSNHADENAAALKLREAFRTWRPDIETNADDVSILVAVQCPGSRGQQDIDIVVLAKFQKPLVIDNWFYNGARTNVKIWNFAATFELKSHSLFRNGLQNVRFVDNKVDVLYREGWSPATLQADGQAKALKARLERETGARLWVSSFVWLYNVGKVEINGKVNEPNAIMARSFTIPELGRKIIEARGPTSANDGTLVISNWVKDVDYLAVSHLLTAEAAVSPLNRSMIEKLIRRRIDFKQFGNLGQQQQIISGRAGSGKTIVLLRTALEFYEMRKRACLLTYNRALVADVNRLLMFMGVKGPNYEQNVNIVTLHSFFIAVIKAIFPEDVRIDRSWLENSYLPRLRDAIEYLKAGAATREDVQEELKRQDFAVFDVACIDEGQDWFDEERDLLHLIVGSENCIVASGYDQLVRQDKLCDWTVGGGVDSGITRLRKCLRLKSVLASFANAVAAELGLTDWEVEPDDDAVGGNVLICIGEFCSHRATVGDIVSANESDGNRNIDLLFCVEPGNLVWKDGRAVGSRLAGQLVSLGHCVWDASVDINRYDPPTALDEFRIVQYQSCRGLEGWIVVAEHLDLLFERKLAEFKPSGNPQMAFMRDVSAEAKAFAATWVMIPLTRAIDTIVVTISNPTSTFGKAVLAVSEKFPDNIQVIQ